MARILKSRLTRRYLFISLIVIVSTLLAIFIVTIKITNDSISSEIQYRDSLIAETLAGQIEAKIDKIINDLKVVAPGVLPSAVQDKEFYYNEIQREVSTDPIYLSIQLFNKGGNILCKAPISSQPLFKLEFPGINYRLSWSQTYYITNMRTLPSGQKTIAIAYPEVDEQGNYYGGVVAYINLATLSDELNQLKIGNHGLNILVDQNNTIIADSDSSLIGTSIRQSILGQLLEKGRYGIMQVNLFQKESVAAYRPLSRSDFGLIVAETVKQATTSTTHVAWLLIRGFTIILLLSIILTLIGTARVVRPVLILIQQAKEYKSGERSNFDPPETKDELESLALTMDRMAKSLTNKERKLYYVLESIPYGVITTDNVGKILTFNKSVEQLTGFSRTEVVGEYLFDIPLKENREEFLFLETLHEGKEFDEYQTYLLDKENNKHDVVIDCSLFRNESNDLNVILVIRDVSDIKKLEQHIQRNERLASLGQFAVSIAHEIKNPLSIIGAAAEAIQLELDGKNANQKLILEWTDDIIETTDRMNKLLTNLLLLSKQKDGVQKKVTDIISLVNELLHLLRRTLSERNISVHFDFQVKEAPAYLDNTRVSQAFLNILLNAVQSMEEYGSLIIRIKDFSQNWLVEIEDTGRGIPASQLPWIFDPFFSTKQEGTGLGLSIANEIIVQNLGKVWVESFEKKGTTFFIQIPKLEKV